jgi:putative FmdB family regulatory protein
MPLHDYECEKCGKSFEHFCKIEDLGKEVLCECGSTSKRVINQVRIDEFKPFWCDRISWDPVYITSKKHLADECKKNGVWSHYLEGSYKRYGEKRVV